jgi:hypothetical protein
MTPTKPRSCKSHVTLKSISKQALSRIIDGHLVINHVYGNNISVCDATLSVKGNLLQQEMKLMKY